ncbi:MAG: riboflavin synthase subunit alpha [Elusimicrobia bacterium RIFOXYA2_FULL_39_19]|nr:MAG: riboflavin synthase subunit alpha [Elusimicrobia bacterium RIFOXYA2_FULL_39_19]
MFTGIIEDFGIIKKTSPSGLEITTRLSGLNSGDSVSVNGVCLTISEIVNCKSEVVTFKTDVSKETWAKTNLGQLKSGAKINLERAMPANGRFGGHIVTGHVEGISKILSIKPAGNSAIYRFSIPEKLGEYMVSKGSVAIDGISLTIAGLSDNLSFTVSVIPFTLKNTTLSFKIVSDTVNIETDILAKYAQKNVQINNQDKITYDLLKKSGF